MDVKKLAFQLAHEVGHHVGRICGQMGRLCGDLHGIRVNNWNYYKKSAHEDLRKLYSELGVKVLPYLKENKENHDLTDREIIALMERIEEVERRKKDEAA